MSELYVKFGKLLQLERQRRKLELASVSEELKITETNLEHIEAGERDQLPSELYFDLFARSYAELLGIDYAKTLEAIREDIGEPIEDEAPEGEKIPMASEKSRSKKPVAEIAVEQIPDTTEGHGLPKKLLWLFAGIVGIFAVFVVLYFVFFAGERATSSGTGGGAETSEETGGALSPAEKAAFASYNWNTPTYTPPPPLVLKLVTRQESWATIIADGDTAFFRTLVPYREYQMEAKYRLTVSLAHPSVVQVWLNGQPVDLIDPETGKISRVEIDQANVGHFLGAPQGSITGEATDTMAEPSSVQMPATAGKMPASTGAGSDAGRDAVEPE